MVMGTGSIGITMLAPTQVSPRTGPQSPTPATRGGADAGIHAQAGSGKGTVAARRIRRGMLMVNLSAARAAFIRALDVGGEAGRVKGHRRGVAAAQ
jgi:hypothetical protein